MGLLGILLTFPVSAPILTANAAIRTIINEAERQLYDEASIRQQLSAAERDHRTGALTSEQFAEIEESLLERLVEARRRAVAATDPTGGQP